MEEISKEEKIKQLQKTWNGAIAIYADCLNGIYDCLVKLEKERIKYRQEYGVDIGPKKFESQDLVSF